MRFIILILNFIYAQDWFITTTEYGKMLYFNPRGISCAKCHGKDAKGRVITTYFEIINKKKVQKKIIAPNIKHITFYKLKQKLLKSKKLSIMPIYNYLTIDEIKAIYLYIRKKDDTN